MASVNISLTKEAYRYLKMLKGKDKSFSDVILDIKTKKNDSDKIMSFFGVFRDEGINWDKKQKQIEKFRESFGERLK